MFLKNKNITFKITRSKVTDYAALNVKSIARFAVVHMVKGVIVIYRIHETVKSLMS